MNPVIGKEILRLGIPAGMQAVIFQVANVFVQTGVNSFDTVTVEGTVAAANADGIITVNRENSFFSREILD